MENLPGSCSGGQSSPPSGPKSSGRPDFFPPSGNKNPVSPEEKTPPIRPLTSTGLFSPPTNLPPVAPPNHPPLSPIVQGVVLWENKTPESIQSGEWDGFVQTPTFLLNRRFWNSRKRSDTEHSLLSVGSFGSLSSPFKIPVVDTASSDLESLSEITMVVNAEQKSFAGDAQRQLELDQVLAKVEADQKKLDLLMRSFTPERIYEDMLSSVDCRLKEIRDLHLQVWADIGNILKEYSAELDQKSVDQFNALIKSLDDKVFAHERSIRAKIKELFPPAQPLSKYEEESLKIQKMAAEAQKALMDMEKEKKENAAKEATIKVNSKAAEFRNKVKVVEEFIKVVEVRENSNYWSEASDDILTDSMKDLSKWDSAMSTVEDIYLVFDNLVQIHGEPNDADTTGYDSSSIKELLKEVRVDFKDAKTEVVKQDKDRWLHSLDKGSVEALKYPTFSGDPGQDLLKFKEKMVYRFNRNRVSKMDQLEKLRESLKGQALRLVPESMIDVDAAWSALKDAFGDPSRVLYHRINSLKQLGDLPPESVRGSPNFEKRVEYLLKFENIVHDIIELGKSDDDLYLLSFNANTVAEVINKFPNNLVLKLNKLPGKGKDRLINILEKIKEFRADAQSLQKTRSLLAPQSNVSNPKKDNTHGNNSSTQVSFNPPRRNSSCRVCCHLSEVEKASPVTGTTFYEDHLSNFATGCPQFVGLDMSARLKLANAIKLCHKCFHPDIEYTREHDKECSVVVDKKHSFSCSKCKMHSWICKYHKGDNKAKLDKYKKEYREKHKLRLVFTASTPAPPEPRIPVQQVDSESVGPTLACGRAGPQSVNFNGEGDSGAAYSANLQAMKKRLKQAGFKGRIIPPPIGEPMFLFQPIQGKDKPVNTFYDIGCSHALFKEGVPGSQLKGRIVQKGPFNMKGVGGITTQANDQWLVALDTIDGNKQMVCGLTVDNVTAEFPKIDIRTAVQEVKEAKPDDPFLQSCKLPEIAGGGTDILLGVMYSCVFPVMVHQLPSGLAIYKCFLKSHNNQYDCLIGGPHKSFEIVAGQVGNIPALIAHFVEGLRDYKTWGAPKIPSLPFTLEEEQFACRMNSLEGDLSMLPSAPYSDYSDGLLRDLDVESEGCSHCNSCNCRNISATSDQDQIRFLKQLLTTGESGVSVEYRCARCRDCWACKNADETEKISLREEQENQLVRDSVSLNFQKKSIDCTLPIRGDEADFLSTNKDLAQKILLSVCNRYHNDETVKQVILAAFQKLFSKGYAKFLDQLTEDELNSFINKDPQYFIPWRVVFADSVTTPCRPVLDASSRTRKRADGSGGRCLNDLVVKGSVNGLDLLRLVLRWQVGKFAMNGDLAQFYNSFNLSSKQWNLQRFLWLDNLDPKGQLKEGVITTLIYGVKSVSAQAEDAIKQLSEAVRKNDPVLADFLISCLYVDDMGESKQTEIECRQLASSADNSFAAVGLKCKGWTFSNHDPPEEVSKNGHSIKIGGVI